MASSLGWLDFSDRERRQVLDVVKLFRDEDTRDELGVGAIRDGFADLLFPGTSTLPTRAGYLLFIPWIYRTGEKSKAKSRDPWRAARSLEIRLIDQLSESEDGEGTIGVNVRAALKTFPSTIYWAALGVFQLRLYRGSQGQYHRWLVQQSAGTTRRVVNDEGDSVDVEHASWHPGLEPPDNFPNGASFQLDPEQGGYLPRADYSCRARHQGPRNAARVHACPGTRR